MSLAQPIIHITEEDYLQGEQLSDIRHEYIDGEVYAMVGSTGEHNTIGINLSVNFINHLRGKPCRPFAFDMKVKVGSKYFYPDVLVDCAYDKQNPHVAGEPRLIVEVSSESTRYIDETTKYMAYQQIPSLQEYVLIEQKFVKVEVFQRDKQWQPKRYGIGDTVRFESIDLALPIELIYERVETPDIQEWISQRADELSADQ